MNAISPDMATQISMERFVQQNAWICDCPPSLLEIVELIVKGLSNKEIADRLSISVDTVKKHSYNSYNKLSVQNRVQLSYFIQNLPAKNQ